MFLLYSIFIYFCNGYKFLTENDLKANEGLSKSITETVELEMFCLKQNISLSVLCYTLSIIQPIKE
jgi:hypothetical protein